MRFGVWWHRGVGKVTYKNWVDFCATIAVDAELDASFERSLQVLDGLEAMQANGTSVVMKIQTGYEIAVDYVFPRVSQYEEDIAPRGVSARQAGASVVELSDEYHNAKIKGDNREVSWETIRASPHVHARGRRAGGGAHAA